MPAKIPETHIRMTLDELRGFVCDVLRHVGLAEDHVQAVAETLVAGERDGCGAHGVYRLLTAVRSIRLGKVKTDAVPQVSEPAPALVRVDGDGGFAQLAFARGLPLLIEKAKTNGIAALAINRCVHFAALWPEVESVANAGLAALAMTANHAWVAPAGGARPLFGTNPIAFGWPRDSQEPFVFDFATSAITRGDLELHRRSKTPLPAGSGIDSEGKPTTDAEEISNGAMLPFGGHKGSALALMVELLAGPLIGDLTSMESLHLDGGVGGSPFGGELIVAFDTKRFETEDITASQRAEPLFENILAQGARLPSQRRYAARKRSYAEGVVIPESLYEELVALKS